MDKFISDRTTDMPTSNPSPIVVPPWPITTRSLVTIDAIATAETRPAAVTTHCRQSPGTPVHDSAHR